MTMKSNTLKFSYKIILPVLLAGMVGSVGVMAKPSGEHGQHMEKKFERLIERLDLTDEQEEKAGLILEQLKETKIDKQASKHSRHGMHLNPGDADYLEKVAERANLKAAHIKSNMIQMATAKQSLYAILDNDQKEKMSKMAERGKKKTQKRGCKKENK